MRPTIYLSFFFAFAAHALAQFGTGEISGLISDSSGAALARATVRIQNEATGQSKTLVADDQGRYTGLDLLAGSYTVEVTASGFKSYVRKGVLLITGDHLAVNVAMELGAVTEKVEVTAATAQVETQSAQVGQVVESQLFMDMPLNGRNPTSIMLLKAGVVTTIAPDSFRPTNSSDARNYYILGSRAEGENLTLDGVTMIAPRNNLKGAEMVSVDAVEEANITTSSYPAEFQRAGAGEVQFITKSGTREFHGTLYEYLRNNILSARSYQTATIPTLRYNQYGFSLGGPVFIPGVFNKNREHLFFFANTEFIALRGQTVDLSVVPTPLERAGNFNGSKLFPCPVDGQGGAPFPGCILPASRLSQNGTALLNLYALPNVTGQPAFNNRLAYPNDEDARTSTFRVDYYKGNQRLFWSGVNTTDHGYGNAPTDFPLVPENAIHPTNMTSLNLTSTLSPTKLNSLRLGAIYRKDSTTIQPTTSGTAQQFTREALGINFPYLFGPNKEDSDKTPTLIVSGLTLVDGSPYPAHSPDFVYQYQDDFSWIHGGHTFKFGAYLEYAGQNNLDQINISTAPGSGNNQNGTFRFAASPGNPFSTGNPLADVLVGRFDSYSEIGPKDYTLERAWSREFYVQDSWKVNSRLHLEFGLRYANWPAYHTLWGNFAMFYPSFYNPAQAVQVNPTTGQLTPGVGNPYNGMVLPGNAFPASAMGHVQFASDPSAASLFHGLPNSISTADTNMFQPRFGLAWDITGRGTTSIRMGGGVFNSRYYFNDATLLGGNPPLQKQEVINNGSVDNPAGTAITPLYPLSVTMQDPHIRQSVTYNYSLTLQRQLPANFILEAGYVGNLSRHLPSEVQLEQLPPGTLQANKGVNAAALVPYLGYSSILYDGNRATSDFNALTASVERRFTHGLMFQASYMFSRSIDDASDKRDLAMISTDLSADRGLSTFDRSNVLSVSYVYQVPFFTHGSARLLRPALAGWQLSGVSIFESGLPTSVFINGDVAGVAGGGTQRANAVGDGTLPSARRTFNQYFNTAAFAIPAQGTFGNSGRNNLRMPGTNNWDVAISKRFPIRERTYFQVRGDFFDIWNHLSYNSVQTTLGNAGFGSINGANPTRVIQVAVRVGF